MVGTRGRAVAWAAAWTFAFAVMSAYWAAGGQIGMNTLGDTIEGRSREPGFVALVWFTAVLKAVGGVLVLFLVRPQGERTSAAARRWVRRLVGASGVVIVVYAGLNLGVRAVMALGWVDTPAGMRTDAALWHLALWNPWWLLGALLFTATALAASPERRHTHASAGGSRPAA